MEDDGRLSSFSQSLMAALWMMVRVERGSGGGGGAVEAERRLFPFSLSCLRGLRTGVLGPKWQPMLHLWTCVIGDWFCYLR